MDSSTAGVVEFLAQVPLFSMLPAGELVELARECRHHSVPKKTTIFFQDDPAHSLYLVYEGAVAILLTSPDGQELILGEMYQGDHFGDLALIGDRPRSTSAVTLSRCEILFMPGQRFMELLEAHPAMMRVQLASMARRLQRSTDREGALAFLDAPARLARVLLMMDEHAVERGYITVSQEALARRTGLTRQTVAKILGRWRRAGWLITGRGRIVLLDMKALRKSEQQRLG